MIPKTLPAEFALFAGSDQWVLRRDKVPVDAAGHPINAQDPAQWMSFETAAAHGVPLGRVFTAADQYFFLDVDHAWDGKQWNATAQWARAALPGAACEISQSGTGLHFFGRYTSVPEHSNKRPDLGLELYTDGRFCACTFDQMQGGPDVDLTAALGTVAAQFPPKPAGGELEWTSGPDPGWHGPTDDAELVAKMLAAPGSAKRAFGGALSFRDLWEGNVPEDGLSEADAALCADLAFWTGRDCERIERLVTASALGQREKWTERPDYRQRTIQLAVSTCKNVYTTPSDVGPEVRPGLANLSVDRQVEYFQGCVWISDVKRVYTPRALLMDQTQFDVAYGGFNFEMEASSPNETSRSAFEVFTKSRAIGFPKADTSGFRPLDTPGCVYPPELGGGLTVVNTYTPAKPLRIPGDVTPFLDYCHKIMPGELNREIALSYMKFIVQHPGVKAQWCLFLQGVEGTGKTFLTEVLTSAVGREDYVTSANVKDIGNVFNANYHRKLLVVLEEVNAHENPDFMRSIKALITNRKIEFQYKGLNQFTSDNCANFILTANNKDGIYKGPNDRRYAPIYLAQQSASDLLLAGLTEDYFAKLWAWRDSPEGRAALNHWFFTTPPVAQFNPAGAAKRAPITENTAEAIAISISEAALILSEACAAGVYGTRGPWLSAAAVAVIFDRYHGFDRRKIAEAIAELGYIKHPGLADGRVGTEIRGGGRTRLYCLLGSPAVGLQGSAITEAYLKAQNHPDGGNVWDSSSSVGGTQGA